MIKILLDHFLQRNGKKSMPNSLDINRLGSCKYISPKCDSDYSNYHKFPGTLVIHLYVCKNIRYSFTNKS